jgi:vitamin B12 transporter
MNFGWASLLPNPNLKAEDMPGWDAGIEQSFFNDKLSFDFGYFNNDYKNYIGYYTDPITWNGTYKNINSARIQGYEGRATWTPNEKFKATVNYTYTDSEDKETGMNLPACPNNRINGTLYWTPHERFNAFAGIETASSRTMSSQSTTRAPGYTDVRLGTNVRLFSYKDANVYFRGTIYNLLNQKISMYRSGNTSYYAPGIHFMAGIFVKYNLPEKTL